MPHLESLRENYSERKFKVLSAKSPKIQDLWGLTPCRSVNGYRLSKDGSDFETSVYIYNLTWPNITRHLKLSETSI